jgi:site-specific recombinase XerD
MLDNLEFERVSEEFIATIPNLNTRNDARWVAHKYFAWLSKQGKENLKEAGSVEIQKFMLECSSELSMNSMRNVRLYLSKLYTFLYKTGLSESSYQALLSFKINHESKVYPLLPRADIAKMLDTIDRTTTKGKRDYAIMMLGTVLGIRACDVVALKLTDIDWSRGELKFVQVKTGKTAVLPLTQDVGEALEDYILNARPKTDSKKVFMKTLSPYNTIASAVTIGEIFRDCCKAAGLPVSKRFHSLRRSLASSMVMNGVTIYDIADGLADTDIDAIKPYLAFDRQHMKMCALSLDGIASPGGDA